MAFGCAERDAAPGQTANTAGATGSSTSAATGGSIARDGGSGTPSTYGAYQNFGDFTFTVAGVAGATSYRRQLDIENSLASVNFTVGNVSFRREAFVSYPDQVMAIRMTSSAADSLNVEFRLADSHSRASVAAGNRITFSRPPQHHPYEAPPLALTQGGQVPPSA